MQHNRSDVDLDRELNAWAAAHARAEVSLEARRSIHALLAPALKPARPFPSQGRLALAFFALFAACGLILIAIMDKAGFHLMTGIQMASMAAILTAAGILFSLNLAARMIPAGQTRLPLSLVFALLGIGVTGAVALLFPWRTSPSFISEGWPCAVMELMVALPATAIFFLLARRGALLVDAGLGGALSGIAAVLALLVLQFRCMFQQAPHLLVWHGATAAIVIGLSTLIGRWRRDRFIS